MIMQPVALGYKVRFFYLLIVVSVIYWRLVPIIFAACSAVSVGLFTLCKFAVSVSDFLPGAVLP